MISTPIRITLASVHDSKRILQHFVPPKHHEHRHTTRDSLDLKSESLSGPTDGRHLCLSSAMRGTYRIAGPMVYNNALTATWSP